MNNEEALVNVVVPNPNWEKELGAFSAAERERVKALGLPFTYAPNGHVPIRRVLQFARAVRAQPDVWERCIVEAERRKHEVTDPNSELRREGIVHEETNPENFVLEWHRFCNFRNWFLYKAGYRDTDEGGAYLNAQFVLRRWNRGEMAINDSQAFIDWHKKNMPSCIIFDDEDGK